MSERTNVSNSGVGANYRTYKIDNSTITCDRDEENGSAQVGLAVAPGLAGGPGGVRQP